MIFKESKLKGAFLICPEPIVDERGYFARCFCKQAFSDVGIDFSCVQCNLSFNKKAGTLRGLHYQRKPYSEAKIVSCVSGSVFDVIVDLRTGSSTRNQWEGFYLSMENGCSLYVPEGFAHGFVTLEDDSCLYYQMSEFYHEGYEGGIRYDDPALGIHWAYDGALTISERDLRLGSVDEGVL